MHRMIVVINECVKTVNKDRSNGKVQVEEEEKGTRRELGYAKHRWRGRDVPQRCDCFMRIELAKVR